METDGNTSPYQLFIKPVNPARTIFFRDLKLLLEQMLTDQLIGIADNIPGEFNGCYRVESVCLGRRHNL